MEINVEGYETIITDVESTSSEETKMERLWRYTKYFMKKFITFLFSHVGLTCMVVVYAILGGFIFKETEAPNEREVRKLVTDTKQRFVDKLVDLLDNSTAEDIFRKQQWLQNVDSILSDFKSHMHEFTEDRNWDGKFGDEEYQWTFADSLLFSVTVITTIGYGHIAPRTTGGKLLTIAYAIFGIPLTMLCLRNIGNLMAVIFRMIYRHTCVNLTYQYIRLKRRRLKRQAIQKLRQRGVMLKKWAIKKRSSLLMRVGSIHGLHGQHNDDNGDDLFPRRYSGNRVFERLNDVYDPEIRNHEYRNRSVSLFPGSTTSGNNCPYKELSEASERAHLSHKRRAKLNPAARAFLDRRKTLCAIQELEPFDSEIEETNTVSDIGFETDNDRCFEFQGHVRKYSYDRQKSHQSSFIRGGLMATGSPERGSLLSIRSSSISLDGRPPPPSLSSSILSLGALENEDLVLKQRLKSTREMVPVSVVLLLMTGYMILGAMMFSPWENWDFMTGFYFCFVTLTSIGFGDIVPGAGATDWDSDEKGILIVLYLVFGMSLLAMSFHLIQEEVKHKCRKIGIKLGLLEDRLNKMLDRIGENT